MIFVRLAKLWFSTRVFRHFPDNGNRHSELAQIFEEPEHSRVSARGDSMRPSLEEKASVNVSVC